MDVTRLLATATNLPIPSLLVFIFGALHIFGAAGWLSLNAIFAFGLENRIGRMSDSWQQEFRAGVFPNLHLQYRIFSSMTIVFGVLFAYAFAGGDLSFFSLAYPIGSRIIVGGVLGAFAWSLGNTHVFKWLTVPFAKLRIGGLEFYVLVIVFLYMVAAAHPYV